MFKRIVIGVGAALCLLASASPSQAAITWDLKPSGTGDWDWKLGGFKAQYINGVFDMKGLLWTYAAGHCLEITTSPGLFVANPDTRIWLRQPDGTMVSLNDDYNGTLQSKGRIWVSYEHNHEWEGYFFTEIHPYSVNGNGDDFGLSITRRDWSSNAEANCTTNTTLPWAKFKGTGFQTYDLILGNAT